MGGLEKSTSQLSNYKELTHRFCYNLLISGWVSTSAKTVNFFLSQVRQFFFNYEKKNSVIKVYVAVSTPLRQTRELRCSLPNSNKGKVYYIMFMSYSLHYCLRDICENWSFRNIVSLSHIYSSSKAQKVSWFQKHPILY